MKYRRYFRYKVIDRYGQLLLETDDFMVARGVAEHYNCQLKEVLPMIRVKKRLIHPVRLLKRINDQLQLF